MNRFALTIVVIMMTVTCGSSQARTNYLEIFGKSNEPACVELQFEGFAVFMRVSFSIFTGISVNFIASPITANYHPDFVVTAYSRLGDSPLLESYVGFGQLQNVLSEPMVEVLTNRPAPATYRDTDLWSGQQAEGAKHYSSALNYFESEVFGHPGNIYSLISNAMQGESRLTDLSQLTTLASDTVKQQVSARASEAITQLQTMTTPLHSQFNDAVTFDPVTVAGNAIAGDLADMINHSEIGNNLQDYIDRNAVTQDEETLLTRLLSTTHGTLITPVLEQIPPTPDQPPPGTSTDDVIAPPPSEPGLPPRLTLQGMPEEVIARVREELGGFSQADISAQLDAAGGDSLASVAQLQDLFLGTADSIRTVQDSVSFGVSVTAEPWQGMCPNDTLAFVPYYLSGFNVMSWRFKVPEIIYPQTYVPWSKKTTVGEFFPGTTGGPRELLRGIGEVQNYGSVYPRNGYLLQADPVKAASTIAFRAAHVVTRPRQPHIYRWPKPRNRTRVFEMDATYKALNGSLDGRGETTTYLEPYLEETGRWQLIYSDQGEEDKQCHRFGDPAVNPVGGAQWTHNKRSDSGDYVYNLWRRYRCAPQPGKGLFGVTHIGNIVLPSPVDIIN